MVQGMSRRACLALAAVPLLPRTARAGTQAEEPLANAVRSALSAAIARAAPPKLSFEGTEARLAHLRWLGAMSDRLHDELAALGIDVLLDDRGERPGAMFADWELIGVPHREVISDRGLKQGQVEYQGARRGCRASHRRRLR